MILFYGIYFGTLGRDFVDRLSDRMATSMGYYNRTGFPRKHLRANVCAICGESTETLRRGTVNSKDIIEEDIVKLTCEHSYHRSCIKYVVF